MRTITRKANGVRTRLRSKRMGSYQSQRLWSQAPRKSMIQKPGKVPEAKEGSCRNTLPKPLLGSSTVSLFSASFESFLKPRRFWK